MQISTIRLDGDTQSRVNLNQELVTEYAEAMREGATFPPVTVFFDGTDNWLSDGFHRLYAARNAGLDEISADVKQGTLRDAKLFSMSANAVHGLRRTNTDKRRAVMMALGDEEWRELSDREIAKMCAVGKTLVLRIRNEVGGLKDHSAELPNSPTQVYNDMPIIQEYKRQINELSEKLANQTPPNTSIAVQQAVRQERERAELAMYEYKKKARELEAQLQAARSTPAPQPVIEVREVVPDDVKQRLEELENIARQKEDELSKHQAELKKLQETLESHRKAGKDLAGIEEKINERYKAYRKLLEKCDKDEEKAKMGIELSTSVMNLTDFLTKHKGYYEHLVRYGAPTHISAGRIKQAAGLCAEISELLFTAAKTISSKEGEFIDV